MGERLKVLLFSDLHCDAASTRSIAKRASGCDLIIGAGDFGNVHRGVKETLNLLRDVSCPAIFVPGNNETDVELRDACSGWENAHILHGSGIELSGISFFGLGGGIPVTPFGSWSFDFTEEQAETLLGDCPPGAVLVSHSPPKGAVDVTSSGKSIGSTAVREAILRLSPRLVVCGHVHQSAGKTARLGNSPIINVGQAGLVVDL